MATLCKTYSTEAVARPVVSALRAADAPARTIRLLTASRLHDVRREPLGGFAGQVGPNAPVGTYSGAACLRYQGRGGFAGNPDRRRQGSYADADRYVIVTYEEDAEWSRVVDHLGFRRFLGSALAGDAADQVANELHLGRAVVLIEETAIATRDADGRLDDLGQAA